MAYRYRIARIRSPSGKSYLRRQEHPLCIYIIRLAPILSNLSVLLGRRLAYVPSAYVSDISRLSGFSVSVHVSQQCYSTSLKYYLAFHALGSLELVLSCFIRPLFSRDIFEFRSTYEAGNKFGGEGRSRVPLYSREVVGSSSGTMGFDIFIKSLHVKCRFTPFSSQVIPEEPKYTRLKNFCYVLYFSRQRAIYIILFTNEKYKSEKHQE